MSTVRIPEELYYSLVELANAASLLDAAEPERTDLGQLAIAAQEVKARLPPQPTPEPDPGEDPPIRCGTFGNPADIPKVREEISAKAATIHLPADLISRIAKALRKGSGLAVDIFANTSSDVRSIGRIHSLTDFSAGCQVLLDELVPQTICSAAPQTSTYDPFTPDGTRDPGAGYGSPDTLRACEEPSCDYAGLPRDMVRQGDNWFCVAHATEPRRSLR